MPCDRVHQTWRPAQLLKGHQEEGMLDHTIVNSGHFYHACPLSEVRFQCRVT